MNLISEHILVSILICQVLMNIYTVYIQYIYIVYIQYIYIVYIQSATMSYT